MVIVERRHVLSSFGKCDQMTLLSTSDREINWGEHTAKLQSDPGRIPQGGLRDRSRINQLASAFIGAGRLLQSEMSLWRSVSTLTIHISWLLLIFEKHIKHCLGREKIMRKFTVSTGQRQLLSSRRSFACPCVFTKCSIVEHPVTLQQALFPKCMHNQVNFSISLHTQRAHFNSASHFHRTSQLNNGLIRAITLV